MKGCPAEGVRDALGGIGGGAFGAVYERLRPAPDRPLREAAFAFLDLLEMEPGGPGVTIQRRAEVGREVERFGFYEHSPEELLWGCRFAWRHSVRCLGRYFWRQLEVRDLRQCRGLEDVARGCGEHVVQATGDGAIQPLITVFAPEHRAQGLRIWNRQLIRYAGYRAADGEVLGDPMEAELTSAALRFGWKPPEERSRFDVLPLLISGEGREAPAVFELDRRAVREVELHHPELAWFRDLGLRWYAVPIISNMVLEIGGIRYPVAPFNGWYMGTEVGARNLGDCGRYDVLGEVAERMGIWSRREATLWRDRALVEVNRAVLFSYQEAGVRMIDHHTAAQLHVKFEEEEGALGRPVTGRWDWLVPPLSGSTTPIWFRRYESTEYSPNFRERLDE